MRVLIIGGSSVSGQTAIEAVKDLNKDNIVISTTSGQKDVKGADHTIYNIRLDEGGVEEKILNESEVKDIDYHIYVPARGQVGISADEATKEMVDESLDYCFRPTLRLHKALQPKATIALSGFITMEPLMEIYGAMTFTKIAMEDISVKNPDKIKILRIGMFHSNSVRGIAILAQRRFLREKDHNPALRKEWKESGKKFNQFFYDRNYHFEEQYYKDVNAKENPGIAFRPTVPEDIKAGFTRLLKGEKAPIVNVLGAWQWVENKMPALPPVIQNNIDFYTERLRKPFAIKTAFDTNVILLTNLSHSLLY